MPSPDALQTHDAGALVLDALRTAFIPQDRVDVAAWAAAHRWVEGARAGRWDPSFAPYLNAPMHDVNSGLYTTTAIVGPGQCGKTASAENWLLASIDADPADMLWYMQTDESLRAYVKQTINPLIEAHPGAAAKQGLRPVDDSLGFKRFRGMTVQFLAAARSNLINKKAARIVADEFDAYDEGLGDPKTLLDVRRQTYGRDSMLLVISHPDRAAGPHPADWNAGIMQIYRDSTRCTWWWPCAACGGFCSPNPGTARHMALTYPDGGTPDIAEAEARLLCPICGALIEDTQRRLMNADGVWIGNGQSIDEDGRVTGTLAANDTAGFWIVGAMSPFLLKGIGGLARARVAAQRAFEQTGEDTTLREVCVKQWGIPYAPPRRATDIDASVIADRAEPIERGQVQPGVRFITASIDVQGNRFEILWRGWGVQGESWVIEHRVVHEIAGRQVNPATAPEDWTAILTMALETAFPLADGSGRVMRVRAAGYDSGGAAGVTDQAYAAWRRFKLARRARMCGVVSGRDAWSLLPLKGVANASDHRMSVVYPDSARKDRRAGARGEIPLGQFNPNRFKDFLANQLERAEPGPGYVHIPAAFRSDQAPHAWFEQLAAEQRTKAGTWEKRSAGARNEVLDLMVMADAMAHLHGLRRFDWAKPPVWAAEWDRNPCVVLPDTQGPAGADSRASAPAAFNPAARRGPNMGVLAKLAARMN